ncbi:zinc-dependent metalloprotease [Sabulilitoribacter arenilitoris]|uniref:Zinc-dependent metalloprotease n=1 Tax=Wocania arenilitoris TaxID=2044858 RepID=A0AAE3ERY9_9FLAO|nr:zinc-dependent metalloprotease [Wocania arenilitoris]MCF7569567.1 zinc-dependent metalloprotease [Wocania arenilitoris]
MKHQKLSALKFLSVVFLMTLFLTPLNAEAQKKKRGKKKDQVEAPAKPAPKKSKEKKISDLVKSSKKIEGLFTMYQDTVTGSLQMLISEDQIDKEFIHFNQVADGVLEAGRFRGAYGGSKVFKIEKYFNKIEFVTQNTSFYFDPENPLSKSKDANISNGIMESVKIEAQDENKGLYLIKADGLFLSETFSQIKPPRSPGQSPMAFKLGNLSKTKTKVNSIRNYDKNTNLVVEYVYSSPSVLNRGSNAVTDGRNVSIKVLHSLIEMPDNDYEIRYDDPRVGYFTTQVTDQTSTSATPYRDLVHRWNLKKKDPNAAISEPVKPITWWIENTTPMEWRKTIKNAVLQWNVAFEKAGFKNAMVVKTQPDDADWDAGDIRYNVLRWTSSPRPPFGGYGPSFVNPKTGQILGADVMLEFVHFSGRVLVGKVFDADINEEAFDFSNENQMRCSAGYLMAKNTLFGQAVVRAFEDSDLELEKILHDNMMRLIMHEVGHTLGLNHNMRGSQLFSPEELSNPELIKGKSLSTSVMEYPAINITRDRSKQGIYYDNAVGPYDEWAIEFGYKDFSSEAEKQELLNKSAQPKLAFGNDADDMRSSNRGIDPRVNIYDLSNDAIGYAIDRIHLVNETMENIKTKLVTEGKSYQELTRAYGILQREYRNSGTTMSRYIGGVYVDRTMAGQEGGTQPYTPVSLEDQKRAMNGLRKYIFSPNAFEAPKGLYNYLARQRRGFNLGAGPEDPKIHNLVLSSQQSVLNHLLHPNTLQRITDSELYGNKYKLSTVMNDLNNAIFRADIYGNVNSFRQNLQLEYTNKLIEMLIGKSSSRYINNAKSMALYNLKKIRTMASPSGNIASIAHKQHLRTLIDNALKEVK